MKDDYSYDDDMNMITTITLAAIINQSLMIEEHQSASCIIF